MRFALLIFLSFWGIGGDFFLKVPEPLFNSHPERIVEEFYRCPYCSLYDDYDEEEVLNHMKTCTYNYNLPIMDCLTCKHSNGHYVHQKCGHANGIQSMCNVFIRTCSKGVSTNKVHMGCNFCSFYERR